MYKLEQIFQTPTKRNRQYTDKKYSTLLVSREMQSKITVRYHSTLARMSKTKKNNSNNFWWGCKAIKSHSFWIKWISTVILERNLPLYYNVKHVPMTQHSIPTYFSKRNENMTTRTLCTWMFVGALSYYSTVGNNSNVHQQLNR